jgi:iron complex outermembrane recepter protein
MNKSRSGSLVTISAAVAASLAASAVYAQAQSPAGDQGPVQDTGALQEVTVTAQFRKENVQTTPLAITAVSGADIAARGETSITEIANNAPSVVLGQTSGAFGPSMAAFIRGVGQWDLDPALEPGVGIYVDDVYFGTLTGSLFDLLDLDRVEVLRGPQGTLEGMNSEGGAVKLYSKKADANESMSFDMLGGSRNHVEIRAGTNFAIADNLFMRLSAVGNQQDGYVTRFNFQCKNPSFQATAINTNVTNEDGSFPLVPGTYSTLQQFPNQSSNCVLGHEGGTGYVGGRMALRWVASDNLEMNLIGDLTNTNQEHPAETLVYAGPGPLVGNAAALASSSWLVGVPTTTPGFYLPYNQNLVPQILPHSFYATYANFCMPAPAVVGAVQVAPGPKWNNFNQQAYCVDPRQTEHNWGASWTTDWQIGNGLTFKNITAFRGYTATWVHDNSVSIWPLDLGAEAMSHHQLSEEARLSGSWGSLLDWTFGGYYFDEKSVYFGHEDLSYAQLFTGLPNLLNFYQNDPILAHDAAGFLHTTWHLTPKLDAILGARFTEQEKTYHYVRLSDDGTVGGGGNGATAPVNGLISKYLGRRWDWRANLDYHLTDNAMVYGQYSTGFKGGGVDPRPFYAIQAQPFKPEGLNTFELGFKTSWFDNHLHANIDGYFSQYNNIQLTLNNCSQVPAVLALSQLVGFNFGSPCLMPYNSGSAHQKGIEFDSQAKFGGLQVDANVSWLNFHYTYVNPGAAVPSSDVTPYTPEWTANAGVQYTLPVGSRGSITARLDGNTRSDIYTAAQNTPYNRTAGYTLYNAHLTWENAKQNWQAIVQVKNLTGKRYYFAQFDLVADGQGTEAANPGAPLELDLEIKHTM